MRWNVWVLWIPCAHQLGKAWKRVSRHWTRASALAVSKRYEVPLHQETNAAGTMETAVLTAVGPWGWKPEWS